MSSKKQADSDDSLDLDFGNIKDAIEIQELRAALRSISERYEQEKDTILRDCEESRQDMDTQMFRLRNEKAYIEVKFRDMEKLLSDIIREKEKQDGIILNLRKDIERLKDARTSDLNRKGEFSRHGSDDIFMSASGDFDLTESVDKFGPVNPNDLYELLQEEINDLATEIINCEILPQQSKSSKDIIYKLIDVNKRIKDLITGELGHIDTNKDLDVILLDIFNNFKQKISSIEIDKAKIIDEYARAERIEAQTEPSPRMSSPDSSFESNFLIKRQLQMEKLRTTEKKHEIHLHKEQISYLKLNIRELQAELDRAIKMDIIHLRELWCNICKEIPLLIDNAEDMLEVFMKMLGFNSKEIVCLNKERKAKKPKSKYGIFG